MALDWKDLSRTDKIELMMVSPQSMDQTYGTLQNAIMSECYISSLYYSDTRTSGSISVLGVDQYVPNSLIRIIHHIPEWGYTNELGTYLVRESPYTRKRGAWKTKLALESRLEGLALNKAKSPWTVAKGAEVVTAMQQMLTECRMEYSTIGARGLTASEPFVYETGSSYLSRLYDLCNVSKNRLDIDSHGTVVVSAYTEPKYKPPKFRLDLADIHGLVKDDISLTSSYMSTPNRAIVSYRYTEKVNDESVEREITAFTDSTGSNAFGARGYIVSDYYEISELEPPTYATALQISQMRLADQQKDKVEWEITCPYFPVWEGDIIELVVHDGPASYQGNRHCLVKSQKISFKNMSMDLVLKETASGDEE